MPTLVSHPDEAIVLKRRWGQGAANIDKYIELDGYKAVQNAIAQGLEAMPAWIIDTMKASRPARPRRRRLSHRHEVELRPQGLRQAQVRPGQRRRVRARHL